MTRSQWSWILTAALSMSGPVACADIPSAPEPPQLDLVSAQSEGALIEVGAYYVPFGILIRDADSQLLLYYRFDDAFPCNGVTPTEFVQATYRDVIRIDESWRTVDKTEGLWFYVYPWNGTPASPGCNFLRTTTPLATGRGHRLLTDNDYFPFSPYGPGPGANAYMLRFGGSLTTPAGRLVQFMAQTIATFDPDGTTVRHWDTTLRLSPDPR